MKHLLLHIGNPKCGSTAMQDYLSKHQGSLKDIRYADNIFGNVNGKKEEVKRIKNECDNFNEDKIFISRETLCGYKFQYGPPRIERSGYRDLFKNIFSDYKITIWLIIRRHDKLIESSYLNAVKNGVEMSIKEYAEKSEKVYFQNQVDHWGIFDNFFVTRHKDYSRDNKGILEDLLERVFDTSLNLPDEFRRKNIGLGDGSIMDTKTRGKIVDRYLPQPASPFVDQLVYEDDDLYELDCVTM